MALFGDDGRSSSEDLRLFAVMTGIAELFGLLSVILTCAWLSNFYGGFGLNSSMTKFNLHPLLMTFAFVFLLGNGILVYRVFRRLQKIKVKVAHAVIQFLVLFIAVIAIKIAWDGHEEGTEEHEKSDNQSKNHDRNKRHAGMHDDPEVPPVHLATLHTWLGFGTVILFIAQWIFGLVSFLYPQLRLAIRQAYLPLHVFWGCAIFVLGALSALTGIVMFSTRFAAEHKLSELNSEAWLINCLGICIVAYVISVIFILIQPAYKRKALPEEDKVPLAEFQNSNDD